MGTDRGGMRSWMSHAQAGVSPWVSTHPQGELPRRSTVLSFPALHAFADGFWGGLIGGLVYCLVLAYFDPDDLEIAWLRVLALALTFGAFEMWRVIRKRTLRSAMTSLLVILTASLLVLSVLGAVFAVKESAPALKPLNSAWSRLLIA